MECLKSYHDHFQLNTCDGSDGNTNDIHEITFEQFAEFFVLYVHGNFNHIASILGDFMVNKMNQERLEMLEVDF